MPLTREQIRERIDALESQAKTLESLGEVQCAIEQVEIDEAVSAYDVRLCRHGDNSGYDSFYRIPPSVVLAALRAMERELMALANVAEVA